MKHIKKKYLFEKQLTSAKSLDGMFEDMEKFDKTLLKNSSKKHNLIIQTSENERILAFIYNNHCDYIHIPLPDFTLVYFDFAYRLNIRRKELQKELLTLLSDIKTFDEVDSNKIYMYYGHASSCVINLFTSIECFINHLLPEDKVFTQVLKNRTESYNKKQIQESIAFWDKFRNVLHQFYGINFFSTKSKATQHIENLKELRDEIIHTKSDQTGELQIKMFKKILNFNYDETFIAVSKMMNFYDKDFIEECKCEANF